MQRSILHVNEWTRDLGDVGAGALRERSRRAKSIGFAGEATQGLDVFGGKRSMTDGRESD